MLNEGVARAIPVISSASPWTQVGGGHTDKLKALTGVELCTSLPPGLGGHIFGFQVKHRQLHVIESKINPSKWLLKEFH